MVGDERNISEFVSFIKNNGNGNNGNIPDYAIGCKVVSEEDKCQSKVMYIKDYSERLAVEQQDNIVQGGLRIEDALKHTNTRLSSIDTKLGSFIDDQREHNKKMDEHNLRLEKILEKLSEK